MWAAQLFSDCGVFFIFIFVLKLFMNFHGTYLADMEVAQVGILLLLFLIMYSI